MQTINITKDLYQLEKLAQRVSHLSTGKVLVIGDIMLDTYLIGDATRISPEAPVPVVKIEEKRSTLGGAGNVALAIAALGGSVSIVGITGKDNTAIEIEDIFHAHNITPFLFKFDSRSTTIKTRVLARSQQMLRMDMESTGDITKHELTPILAQLKNLLENYEYIVISDYAKGMITQELMDFLTAYKNSKGETLKILADPKPQNISKYQNLFLLTPNAKETSELTLMPTHSLDEVEKAGEKLHKNLHLDHLLTTLGAEGMALFSTSEPVWHIPTTAQQVFDVTGAGDTVIATLALALSANFNLLDACILANYAAGIVVGKIGSATATQNELLKALHT